MRSATRIRLMVEELEPRTLLANWVPLDLSPIQDPGGVAGQTAPFAGRITALGLVQE
jgi:hypothetical protein